MREKKVCRKLNNPEEGILSSYITHEKFERGFK